MAVMVFDSEQKVWPAQGTLLSQHFSRKKEALTSLRPLPDCVPELSLQHSIE